MKKHNIPMDGMEDERIRVLVVDDDPEIVELFVDVLESDGRFDVSTAQTGYDAGVMTQQFRPDIVVLDYMLPDINGNVVCRTIRDNPELSHIKILIISGMVNPAEIDELKQAGADDFIRKPFNIEGVVKRIVELVKA
ncbi:MAG: response regulator [Planctomycetota bacterium]|jgi:DNA-binding response OmpR family regulator